MGNSSCSCSFHLSTLWLENVPRYRIREEQRCSSLIRHVTPYVHHQENRRVSTIWMVYGVSPITVNRSSNSNLSKGIDRCAMVKRVAVALALRRSRQFQPPQVGQ